MPIEIRRAVSADAELVRAMVVVLGDHPAQGENVNAPLAGGRRVRGGRAGL